MAARLRSGETETADGEVTSDGDGTNRLLATLCTYLCCWLNELGIGTSLAMAMAAWRISGTAAATNGEAIGAENYSYAIFKISRTRLRYWLNGLGHEMSSPVAMMARRGKGRRRGGAPAATAW